MSRDDSFSLTPPTKERTKADQALEDFVRANTTPRAPAPTKRLTITVPAKLHARVKLGCVKNNETIADVVRQFLEKRFPDGV